MISLLAQAWIYQIIPAVNSCTSLVAAQAGENC